MSKKVLIVDDDPDLVHMIRSTLEKSNFEVATAPDGDRALRALKTFTPDLIISDLTMPVMSGWQLSMKIRLDPRFKTTPIIILSGMIEYEKRAEDFEPGTYYMGKPFEIFHLVDKVKELLNAA